MNALTLGGSGDGPVLEVDGYLAFTGPSDVLALNSGTLDIDGGTLFGADVLDDGGSQTLVKLTNGTIFGGTLLDAGGSTVFDGTDELSGVTYLGYMNLSNGNVDITNGITFSDVGGTGSAVVSIDNGAQFEMYDGTLLSNVTFNIDPTYDGIQFINGSSNNETLTVASSVTVEDNGNNNSSDCGFILRGSNNAIETIISHATINAEQSYGAGLGIYDNGYGNFINQGQISVSKHDKMSFNVASFRNDGNLTVSEGQIILNDNAFVNAGTITIASGGGLVMDASTFTNTGAIEFASGSTLEIQSSLSLNELESILAGSDVTLIVAGTLDLGDGTLSVSAGGQFSDIDVLNGGTLANGVVNQDGTGTLTLQSATLDHISYAGTLDVSGGSNQLYIENGLIANGGVINLTNPSYYGNDLMFQDSETLNNQTILTGAEYAGYAIISDLYGTLTLGPQMVISQLPGLGGGGLAGNIVNEGDVDIAGDYYFDISGSYDYATNQYDDVFVNAASGTISVASSAGFEIYSNLPMFDNAGLITVASGAVLDMAPQSFVNTGTILVASGGELVMDTGTFINTGMVDFASGATLDIQDSISLNDLESINTNGSAAIEIDGTLDLMGGTLTVGSGSALGQVTLENSGAIINGTVDDLGNGLAFAGSGGVLSGLTYIGVSELAVASVVAPVQAIAGQIVPITWTDRNDGNTALVGTWTDKIFEASDPEGDNATLVGTPLLYGTLAAGGTLTSTDDITLPTLVSGDEYIIVKTNVLDPLEQHIGATQQTTVSQAIDISRPPQPVLTVTSITPPTSALSGQQTEITWVVTNEGDGSTSSAYWTDNVYLSLDRTLDTSDILLASVPNQNYLAAGASYENSATVTLPQGISGPYYIIVQTDVGGQIGNHGGNQIIASETAASLAFPVVLSPAADLQISSIITRRKLTCQTV